MSVNPVATLDAFAAGRGEEIQKLADLFVVLVSIRDTVRVKPSCAASVYADPVVNEGVESLFAAAVRAARDSPPGDVRVLAVLYRSIMAALPQTGEIGARLNDDPRLASRLKKLAAEADAARQNDAGVYSSP